VGECNRCCRTPNITVEIKEHEAERYPGAWLDDDGTWRLPKKDNGECAYLVDGKCSIYANRPFTCRTFDCRWHLLVGFLIKDDPIMEQAVRQWAPLTVPTPEDKEIITAVRLAIADGGIPGRYEEALEKATRWPRYIERARAIRREFAALTSEQWRQLQKSFGARP
jgi:Fe-S-cluster containining protein